VVAVELTRRDVLHALFGATAGAAACATKPLDREIPGTSLGPSMAVGHALADAVSTDGAVVEEVPVVIVGGGASGLTCGWRLLHEKLERFVLLELEPRTGGTAISDSSGGLDYPWGAHYLPCPARDQVDLLELLRETGSLVGYGADGMPEFEESHLVVAPKERIYLGGAWSEGLYPSVGSSTDDREQQRRFSAEIATWVDQKGADGRRAFSMPLDRSSEDPTIRALDAIAMGEWLDRRGYTSPRLRWFVEYGCRDDYGTELGYTSAWAGLHYLCSRTEERKRESADLLAWPSGNGFLMRHLAEKIGAQRIRSNSAVARLVPSPDGRRVDVIAKEPGRTVIYRAERVVLAVPSFLRRLLTADHPERERLVSYAPPFAPWLVANIHLRERPRSRGFPPAWDNVIYQSAGLGYVVATHQALRDHGPTIWTYYLPILGADAKAARKKLQALDRKQAVDAILSDLGRAHVGLVPAIERIDVWKWGHGMARPEPGLLMSPARARAAEPFGAIHFAHSDLSGVGLFEEAFSHGNRAAREVARAIAT